MRKLNDQWYRNTQGPYLYPEREREREREGGGAGYEKNTPAGRPPARGYFCLGLIPSCELRLVSYEKVR